MYTKLKLEANLNYLVYNCNNIANIILIFNLKWLRRLS